MIDNQFYPSLFNSDKSVGPVERFRNVLSPDV